MNRTRGEAYRNMKLCVDKYEGGVLSGRFYHPLLGKGEFAFNSLMQLLIAVENAMEEANFPQSYTAKRSFAPLAQEQVSLSEGEAERGELGTFGIRILFRQHASWQGSITWVEGKSEQSFRSVLELMLLIDSALVSALQAKGSEKVERVKVTKSAAKSKETKRAAEAKENKNPARKSKTTARTKEAGTAERPKKAEKTAKKKK